MVLTRKHTMELVKGMLMTALGIALLVLPEFTLLTVTQLVASLLLVKGVVAGLILLFSKKSKDNPSLVLELILDLGIGLLILSNPGGTISFFVVILAIWAILGGLLMAFSFTTLRRLGMTNWVLFVNSLVALTFGLALIFEPLRGGFALASVIGAFAFVFGVMTLLGSLAKKRQ